MIYYISYIYFTSYDLLLAFLITINNLLFQISSDETETSYHIKQSVERNKGQNE